MKTRHEHKLGARLFLAVPNYSLLDSGEWAFLYLSIYDPFTISVEKSRTLQTWQDKCFRKKKLGVQIQKYHYRIGKRTCSEWCAGVYVWKGCGMSVAGSPGEFLVWRFCFVWSFGQNFLFRTARNSRHRDLGLCKYILYKEHHQFGF